MTWEKKKYSKKYTQKYHFRDVTKLIEIVKDSPLNIIRISIIYLVS